MEALRKRIQGRFNNCIAEECPRGEMLCRGGSHLLYHLILRTHKRLPIKEFDPERLRIVSGLGHTFLIYDQEPRVYIDPTISQFNPEYSGIFVGTQDELFTIVTKKSDQDDYRPMTTNQDLMNVVPKDLKEKYAKCYETRSGGKKTRRRRSLYRKSHKNRK